MPYLITAIYMVCFWEFLMKFLPVPGGLYPVLTQMPELVILLGILNYQYLRFARTGTINIVSSGLTLAIAAFVGWALLVTVMSSQSDGVIALLNLKAIMRYVFVLYLVACIRWDKDKLYRIKRAFLICFALQLAIGVAQLTGGRAALAFFSPASIESGFGFDRVAFNDRGRDGLELFGTFRNTIGYAYLMLVVCVLRCVQTRAGSHRMLTLAILSLGVVFSYLSGSRIVAMIILMVSIYYLSGLRFNRTFFRFAKISAPIAVILCIFLYLQVLFLNLNFEKGTMFYVFTPDYIESAMNQRLGIVLQILPAFILEPQVLFGMGADKFALVDFIARNVSIQNAVLLATLQNTIEDVYWVAMVFYYGIIGTTIWVVFLGMVYTLTGKATDSPVAWISEAGRISRLLLLLAIPLNFVNQAFEVQIFALALWMFSGIAIQGQKVGQARSIPASETR